MDAGIALDRLYVANKETFRFFKAERRLTFQDMATFTGRENKKAQRKPLWADSHRDLHGFDFDSAPRGIAKIHPAA